MPRYPFGTQAVIDGLSRELDAIEKTWPMAASYERIDPYVVPLMQGDQWFSSRSTSRELSTSSSTPTIRISTTASNGCSSSITPPLSEQRGIECRVPLRNIRRHGFEVHLLLRCSAFRHREAHAGPTRLLAVAAPGPTRGRVTRRARESCRWNPARPYGGPMGCSPGPGGHRSQGGTISLLGKISPMLLERSPPPRLPLSFRQIVAPVIRNPALL